jgi:hypothetical protein
MTDKIFLKIQNDIKKSNPIIINNDDNTSKIKKNLNNSYKEDLSDTDDELTSYKNRNKNIINDMDTKSSIKNNLLENCSSKSNNKKNNKKDNKKKLDNKTDNKTENSDNENNIAEYEFLQDFEEKVKQYVKSDDKIRELQLQIKELNAIKKKSEQEILKHLERLGDSKINISGGKLRVNQYESKDGFKETIVKDVMIDKIKDPKIVETIFETINEKRKNNSTIQLSLKRTFEKNKN